VVAGYFSVLPFRHISSDEGKDFEEAIETICLK